MANNLESMPMPEENSKESADKILPANPKLRYLDRVFDILRSPEKDVLGGETNWRGLSEKVKPFKTGLEFTDNIREAVMEFVSQKIPRLKEGIPSFKNLKDKDVLEAISHNWFETVGEEVGGKRKEVLLATAAHVVRRIENNIYKKLLRQMQPADLEKLGLDASTRDLLVEVLDASIKADPMYIRFMAYSQLSPEPPEEAGNVTFSLPKRKTQYTAASLFPHEAQFLAGRFAKIAENHEKWSNKSGGEIFKKYLEALSAFYAERNPDKAPKLQENVLDIYKDLLNSDFPIFITPTTEGYYKEPYFDPELKVSVVTPDARKEEASWLRAQEAMSSSLQALDADKFSENMKSQPVRSMLVFGGFGSNIIFNAVAQEKPAILIFLNEQMRAYDREFSNFVFGRIKNAPEIFGEPLSAEKRLLLEKILRTDTVLHELAHSIHPDDSPEAKRLGRKPLTILDEVKAEICYRPLVPEIIEKNGLDGKKEEWAVGMLASSLFVAEGNPKGDPYYYAAAYCLNNLFERGAVELEGKKLIIKNFDLYYAAQKEAAEALLAVYRDPSMTQAKAAKWIKRVCEPNKKVQAALL